MFTKQTLINWMKRNIADFADMETGEVNATQLAEAAADNFNHPEWLEDETGDVWDAAAEVSDWAEMALLD